MHELWYHRYESMSTEKKIVLTFVNNRQKCVLHVRMKTDFFHLFFVAFLFIGSVATAESERVSEIEDIYQAGLHALSEKKSRDAFNAFQRVVKLDSSFVEAHYQLGVLYGNQSQWKLAVRAFETAIKISPNFADAHCRLGEAYLIGLARAKEAIPPLKRAIQLQPNFRSAQRLLGIAYLHRNRIDDAIHHLKRLAQDISSDVETRYLLGLAYFQSGNFVQAIPHFETVIKREKLHAKAHFNLGNCYLRTGRVAKGRAVLQTYEALIQDEERLNTFRRLILDGTQRLDIRYQFAELLMKREEWEAAIVEFKTCIAMAPLDKKGYELLGYLYIRIESYSDAEKIYGHLVKEYPQSAVYRNSLGVVYMMLEKPRQAIVQFETATRLGITNLKQALSLHRNLAKAYRQIGDKSKAAEAYQLYLTLKTSRGQNEMQVEQK